MRLATGHNHPAAERTTDHAHHDFGPCDFGARERGCMTPRTTRTTLAAVLLDLSEILAHSGNAWLRPSTRAELVRALTAAQHDLHNAIWPDDADATRAAAALGISAATLFRLRRILPRNLSL
jgi:hypothetical protein